MNKALLLTFLIFCLSGNAQVKIGTNPIVHPSAMLEVESSDKGFLPPRLTTAQRNAIPSPVAGLIIYNTEVNCMEWYTGTAWKTSCINAPASVTGITCASRIYSPQPITAGAPYVGTITVPYTGGNLAYYGAGTPINSTTVTGLTAVLRPGTLGNGAGNFIYDVTGTPSGAGNANFALSFNGAPNCSVALPVVNPVATLTCAGRVVTGTLTSGVPASGVSISVPFTGGNGASYPQGTPIASTGVLGLTATLQAGTATSTGTAVYIISGTPATTTGGTATFALAFPGSANCSAGIPVGGPAVSALTCATASMNPSTIYAGVSAAGTTITLPYTGGNGATYAAAAGTTTVTGTGAGTLAATLVPGTLANGSGNLTYNITGIPAATGGPVNFNFTFGGRTCTYTIFVPAVATIACASKTGPLPAPIALQPYSGTITVPYTGGNGGQYPTGNPIPSTVITGLTVTLQPGTLASGAGNFTYTITGTPSAAGTANFAITFGNRSCTLQVTVTN